MPDNDKTGESSTAVATRPEKLGFAEAVAHVADEPAGETKSADKTQSKTTDKVGDGQVDDDKPAGDQDDDKQGSETDDSETEDGEEKDGEEEEEDPDQESDDEVDLPEPVAKIVEELKASNPDHANEIRAFMQDQKKLIDEADRTIMANAGVLGIFEALTLEETQKEAFDTSIGILAKEIGTTVPALMQKLGYVPAPTGDVATPEFLAEGNHEALITEVLKEADFQEDAGLQDAKLGAKMMLEFLIAKVPEMLPADYHGGYQDYIKQTAKESEQSAARAEATKVAKSNFASVASEVRRLYEGYKVTEDQVREAIEAFPMLPKTNAKEVYKIVAIHLEPKLRSHLRTTNTKREKKKMPDSAGRGGDHKPKARTPFQPGNPGMKFSDSVPG